MNYGQVGFDMGMAADIIRPSPPRMASPPRDPLPAARSGFTRSATKDDVCVCPNCGDELCAGDNEVKKQIFAVKVCGHVSLDSPSINDPD